MKKMKNRNWCKCIALVVGFSFFLVGCQKTPDQKAVQQKDVEVLMSQIEETQSSNLTFEAPQNFSDSILSEDGKTSININASIDTGETLEYSAVTIVPKEFTNENAEVIYNALVGDKPLYQTYFENILPTKDLLDCMNLTFQKWIDSSNDPEYITSTQEQIDFNRAIYDQAPNTRYETEIPLEFVNVDALEQLRSIERDWPISGVMFGEKRTEQEYMEYRDELIKELESGECENPTIKGVANLGNDREAFFNLRTNESGKNTSLRFEIYDTREEFYSEYGYTAPVKEQIKYSQEEALEIAYQKLSDMGIDYMVMEIANKETDEQNNDLHYGYLFYFVRAVNNMKTTATVEAPNLEVSSNASVWKQENIVVAVDNTGVNYLYWESPSELKTTLNENVNLLEFDLIMDTLKEQIMDNIVYIDYVGDEGYIEKCEFVIDRIVLGNMTISQKNSKNEYLMLPVWDFFGHEIITYTPDYIEKVDDHFLVDENNTRTVEEPYHSYLTINAVDGSIIDRTSGK